MPAAGNIVLSVRDLTAGFHTDAGRLRVLDRVSFDLKRGRTLGLVGESGCGKSVTSLAIMRLLPKPSGFIESGSILFDGQDLLALSPKRMRVLRGRRIAMIFQEPMTALNPVHKIGRQLAEVYHLHFPRMDKAQVSRACIDMLDKVGIPEPEKRLDEYPHQLSGGMRQRVMIAMALACEPDVLIADEPTTALDVTTQAQILELMQRLQADMDMSIIFITHDLGVVTQMADEVVVMYAGRVFETAPVEGLFARPAHPYTEGLIDSVPRLEGEPKTEMNVIKGNVPELSRLPEGCCFRDRCPHARPRCAERVPDLETFAPGHQTACLRWQELYR